MQLLSRADLEADDEIVEIALSSAVEVLGVVGEVGLAGKLEQSRREVATRITKMPAYEQSHARWLAQVGVLPDAGLAVLDSSSALAVARAWLAGVPN